MRMKKDNKKFTMPRSRQVIPNIDDTFTEEGGPGIVAAEVFEQFIWLTTGVNGRTPLKEVSGVNVYKHRRKSV